MVTLVNLFEAIEQNLLIDAREAVVPAIRAWGRHKYREMVSRLGLGDSAEIDAQIRKAWADDGAGNGESASRLRDRINDLWTSERDRLLDEDPEVLEEVRDLISRTLSRVARAHVEDRLGAIETYAEKGDTGNLFWLQHLIVHLSGDTHDETGQGVRTAGGAFHSIPNLKRDFRSSRQAGEVHASEPSTAIKVYIDDKALGSMIEAVLTESMHEALYGDAMREREDPVDSFLHQPLSTFVHEVVHLEQESRAMKLGGRGMGMGISHIPKSTRGTARTWSRTDTRGSDRKNKNPAYRDFRPGKRGHPDRLNNAAYTEDQFATYLGMPHEIEAHAAGAASAILSELLMRSGQPRWHQTARDKQQALNDLIDKEVDNLRQGYATGRDNSSLKNYQSTVLKNVGTVERTVKQPRDAAGKIDTSRRRYPLPKVDEMHRKVWRLFLLKVVRHLLGYRKPVDWGEDAVGSRRQPRAAKVGGITFPARRPRLPDGEHREEDDWTG